MLKTELFVDAILSESGFIPPDKNAWHSLITARTPHDKQRLFVNSKAKRKVIRAGRRGGKTVGIAILAVEAFKAGKRVLYAAPTEEQVTTFWFEVKAALREPIAQGHVTKNETSHVVEVPDTKNRIRAKTAWNAETLRGDYADLLILDEFQLMDEDTWGVVGAPMLMDNDGDAVFIYTPPSLHGKFRTKAKDPRFISKLFKRAEADTSGRWQAFHFTSLENPFNSKEAMAEITSDMTRLAYEQEILADDKEDVPGALWNRALFDRTRVTTMPALVRVSEGVDPPGGATFCGIGVAGIGTDGHFYFIADDSIEGSPAEWSNQVIATYTKHKVDRIVGEKNYGGDMVEHTIRTAPGGDNISYRNVTASRGKALRAEPIAALFEQGRAHLVGNFPHLEEECCTWLPNSNMPSPNRLDAMVWAMTELSGAGGPMSINDAPSKIQDLFGGFGA